MPNRCDKAMAELKVFNGNEVKKMQSEFSGLSFRILLGVAKYKELSFILRLLLAVSYGQAAVERGFSHNNAILKTNMSPEREVSKRMIKDYMLSFSLKPHPIEITNPLIVASKSSHRRYEIHLEEEKKKKQVT